MKDMKEITQEQKAQHNYNYALENKLQEVRRAVQKKYRLFEK